MFKPRHTFESVSRMLTEGLSSGSVLLDIPWSDDRTPPEGASKSASSRQWRRTAVAAVVCSFVLLCVASGAVAVLVQKNASLQHEIAGVAANLRDTAARTARLQESQGQIEEKLRISQQQAETYRQELVEAKRTRLNAQSTTYPGTEPSVATLMTLAMVHQESGDLERARGELLRALTMAKRAGDRRNEAATLELLGELSLKQGDIGASENFLHQAVEINQVLNDNQALARSLTALGTAVKAQGRTDEARALYDRAASILNGAPASGMGRLSIINNTGAPITVSWSGTSTGTQTFSGTTVVPITTGEYTLSIKTRCGSETRSLKIGTEGSQSITYACMPNR